MKRKWLVHLKANVSVKILKLQKKKKPIIVRLPAERNVSNINKTIN